MNKKIDSLIEAGCQQRWRSHHVTIIFFIMRNTVSQLINDIQGTIVLIRSIVLILSTFQATMAFYIDMGV